MFGVVYPYVQNFTLCDLDNSIIRFRQQTITMAYNCGTDGPDADEASFKAENLLKQLRDETVESPDVQGSIRP